jgi:hypothetical protein
MTTGIYIICRKITGQWLLRNNPYCLINNFEVRELMWDHPNFIPLINDVPYVFSIQFRYLGGVCGTAGFSVVVRAGEVQTYEYETPFFAFSPGKIRRVQ